MILQEWLARIFFTVGLNRRVVDPMGPVFLSYRQSDGREWALRLAKALRAWGVPVWHDLQDLPPGEWERSIQGALRAGLSGGVLIVTPEIGKSDIVRNLELPALLRLAKVERFTFAIATAMAGEDSKPDWGAANGLLLPGKKPRLKDAKQYSLEDIQSLARDIALRRMSFCRESGERRLLLDLQTRREGRAWAVRAPLVLRVPVPEGQRRPPPREVWENLRAFLAHLPELIEMAGADQLLVRGGAHLSVAAAIGAGVPRTAHRVKVEDKARGLSWSDLESAGPPDILADAQDFEDRGKPGAVLVDLVPTNPPHDTFGQEVDQRRDSFSGFLRITRRGGEIPPAQGAATAAAVARFISEFASQLNSNEIHLFLRVPWPLALFLGRELNTLRVHLYEWDDLGQGSYRYAPTVTIAAGVGGGPVTDIAAEDSQVGGADGNLP